jgi:hypothetical protein
MYSSQSQGKANKGSVQFKTTKGRLQIVFSYLVQEGSEIKRKQFYISIGYEGATNAHSSSLTSIG